MPKGTAPQGGGELGTLILRLPCRPPRCFAMWWSLGLPLHQPGRQTVFAWGRPGECRVTSNALEVILSNGEGVKVGVAAC